MSEYIERTSEIILAANAGARAIENTKRYHGAFYTRDVFADNSAEIAYLQAAKVLRDIEDAPAADVEPVRHGTVGMGRRWILSMLRMQTTCSCGLRRFCRRLAGRATNSNDQLLPQLRG